MSTVRRGSGMALLALTALLPLPFGSGSRLGYIATPFY